MSNPSKKKGSAYEREIAQQLVAYGIVAEKVPGSGVFHATGHDGDIIIKQNGYKFVAEAKIRQRMKMLYDWMGAKDFMFVRQNNSKTLVVVRIELFIRLLGSLLAGGPPVEERVSSEGEHSLSHN